MAHRIDSSSNRLDDAARAGWLYYVAGNTQEEIATKLGISRQSAQRLVSLSVSEGLIKVRLDHPIGRCMDLASRLKSRFALDLVEIERWLKRADPIVIAVGTGRTLKAAVEQLMPMECPHHKVVSLTGNIAPDGSAAYYNVIFNVADTVKARSFPMPLPVIASSARERELLHAQPMIRETLALAAQAHVSFVGIGDIGPDAPLYLDGFITDGELKALQKAGAVGEICGWTFDADGRLIEGLTNDRVASAPMPSRERSLVVAIAMGKRKLPGIRATLNRRLVNGLITDESTALGLLNIE